MYCAMFQGEESTEGAGGKGEKKASGHLHSHKEATGLWHNLRSLAEWSIPVKMMVNQLLCTCLAPWLPLEGSSLVMTLGCEWSDHLECEHDHSVQLCKHVTLFKWLLLSTTNLTLGWEWCCVLWRVHMINWYCQLIMSTFIFGLCTTCKNIHRLFPVPWRWFLRTSRAFSQDWSNANWQVFFFLQGILTKFVPSSPVMTRSHML